MQADTSRLTTKYENLEQIWMLAYYSADILQWLLNFAIYLSGILKYLKYTSLTTKFYIWLTSWTTNYSLTTWLHTDKEYLQKCW
jgi:hypothetical protein